MRRLDQNLAKFSFGQLKEFLPWYGFALVFLIALHQIQSYLPFLAKKIGDLVADGKLDSLHFSEFLLLALGIVVFRTLSRLLFFYPARKLEVYMRLEFMECLEKTPPVRYENEPKGQIFQYVYADIIQIRALIGFAFLQVANVIISFSIIIPKIVEFNSALLLGFVPLVFCSCVFYAIIRRLHVYFRRTMDLQGDVQNILIESYNGKKTIKNFHAESSFLKLFNRKSIEELENFYSAGKGNSFAIPLIKLGVGLSLIAGAYIVRSQGMESTSFLVFSGFIFLLLEPLSFLSWIGVVFSRSSSSWKRLKEFWRKINTVAEKEIKIEKEHKVHFIENGDYVFETLLWDKPLKLSVKRGQWNSLIGDTASGKTFLLENMMTLIRAKEDQISYVAQEPYIYNDSLFKNIFLGREVSESEKKLALDLIKVFELDSLEKKGVPLFELELGENGKQVSGGQAKRICLIRSLMAQTRFIFWDDPFSSVDVILEKSIVRKLRETGLLNNKTIVMTTHRLSTFKMSDHGIFIDRESNIEEGLREDLLTRGKRTYEHFRQQMV